MIAINKPTLMITDTYQFQLVDYCSSYRFIDDSSCSD